MDGKYQNSIATLPKLGAYRYENILKMYQTSDKQYFYNLLQSIFLPEKLDERALFYLTIQKQQPWTTISFNAYKTIELWWLILLTNNLFNPFEMPAAGTVIKLIKPQYVPSILKDINAALN